MRYGIPYKGSKNSIAEWVMRKAVYHMVSATPRETFEAKRWLEERGFSTDL